MSKEDQYTEKIHQYFDRELSESEKVSFEKQLNQDPLLREEFELQKSLIDSIKSYRKTELKARLDNIPVPSPITDGATASGLKLGGALILATAVGIGAYFYFSEPENESLDSLIDENIEIIDEPMLLPPIAKTQDIEAIAGEEPYAEGYQKYEQKAENTKEPVENLENTESVTDYLDRDREEISRNIQPEILESFADDESLPSAEDVVVPESHDNISEKSKIAELEIVNTTDSKYGFHYKHFNDKLYLFGDFDAAPYEILELNGSDTKIIYLYYNGNYFAIKENITEVTPLEKISDPLLILELDDLREREN